MRAGSSASGRREIGGPELTCAGWFSGNGRNGGNSVGSVYLLF
jgi:hypothetical protein